MQQKSELQTNDKIQGQVEYPHNLLRNIAKESALTEYVLGKLYQNATNRRFPPTRCDTVRPTLVTSYLIAVDLSPK